ncbi:MAG: hypothetical protein UZ17_ACD001002948 [Acidobacteria bacterium OLB17]|nr:MAG: hypothetical protein UZ17_ACD001002948 [Acidobacteria bacterium OLB17]
MFFQYTPRFRTVLFASCVSQSRLGRKKRAADRHVNKVRFLRKHHGNASRHFRAGSACKCSRFFNLRSVFGNGNGHGVPDLKADSQIIDKSKPVDATEIIARLESRKKKAAVELGIAVDEVESLPFNLSKLESEGIFMNIDCRGFGSLVRQLEWKTLGVKLSEDAAVRVSPPRAGLLPDVYRNKLMRGAAQAHNALTKYSFRFTLCETVWGTSEYKWIPWSAFEQFEAEYLKANETLAAAKAETLENYDEILNILQDSFYSLAEDSADRFQATTDEPFDRAEFINAVAAQAIGMVPTPEMIRDGLTIEMKPKVIILGSEIAAEQKLTRELRLEAMRVDADTRAVAAEIESKERIERLKVSGFEHEQKREREVKERIRSMKIEAARREAEEAVSPIKEGLAQITARICEAAQEMSERLHDAKFVPGSLAKRARQMCEWYSLMNFTGDDSLENVLVKLRDAAGREAKQRSPEEMRNALNDILRATTVQSRKLLDEDRLSALEL